MDQVIIHYMRRFNVLEFVKEIGDLVKKSKSDNLLNFTWDVTIEQDSIYLHDLDRSWLLQQLQPLTAQLGTYSETDLGLNDAWWRIWETPQCSCWLFLRSFDLVKLLLVVPAVSELSASALRRFKMCDKFFRWARKRSFISFFTLLCWPQWNAAICIQIAPDCILEYLNFQIFLGQHVPECPHFLMPLALIIGAVAPILHIFPVMPHQGKTPGTALVSVHKNFLHWNE